MPPTPALATLNVSLSILMMLYWTEVDNPDITWGDVIPKPADGW